MTFKLFKISFLLMLFFFGCSGSNIEFKNIEPDCIDEFNELKSDCIFIERIIDSLESNNYAIEIQIDSTASYNRFVPKQNHGIITFKNGKQLGEFNAVIEEFFHAYQYVYYGNANKIPISNLEYEAKLFRNLVLFLQDRPMAETPSQKGLLEIIYYIHARPEIIKNGQFDETAKMLYFKNLQSFQEHWQRRDSIDKTKTGYSESIDLQLLPEACLGLISESYNG